MTGELRQGEWYRASDGKFYRHPDPTPYDEVPLGGDLAPLPAPAYPRRSRLARRTLAAALGVGLVLAATLALRHHSQGIQAAEARRIIDSCAVVAVARWADELRRPAASDQAAYNLLLTIDDDAKRCAESRGLACGDDDCHGSDGVAVEYTTTVAVEAARATAP